MKFYIFTISILSALLFSENNTLFFDGDAYVEIPAHSSYQLGSSDFTIQLWAYIPSTEDQNIGNSYHHFSNIHQGDDYSFKAFRGNNDIYFYSNFSTSGISANYVTDEYTNISITRDDNVARIYINGELIVFKMDGIARTMNCSRLGLNGVGIMNGVIYIKKKFHFGIGHYRSKKFSQI